ncbi:MAG: 4-aminobutyrate--2-oxoglutarate transaminase [Candidatus Eremiobacteraeota bacterium]|nr:4-aminobutyrate--2-oxoglutarate transaminase [Candidatus Eremiobacteraeota bacterium]MBV9055350.1 4-aminobutyrate--2-oxoglutarate transaminase [Candidatus Eremiobacteraeota bacterium]MBV9701030.1 4-aminobutyrate--2-oxoglutarate transaminase [Candidatus Eremiobacteraeota bacterium]
MSVPQARPLAAKGKSLTQRRADSVPRGVGTAHPIWAARAHGATLWDADGRRYVDFAGGIGTLNAGHTNKDVVAAIAEQAALLTHACFQVTMYEPYVQVAETLNRRAPGSSPKKTLLLSTGAEATENAVKIAREHTRRPAVIAFEHGFHGRTLLALSMTGKERPYKQHFGPYCSDVHHVPFPYEPHGVSTNQALAAIARLFDSAVPAQQVAAFIVEPVLGEGGFVPAPPDFLRELRRIADDRGIVLIADEIQTGFGRTGRLFACEHYGIEPDLLTVAKSLGGGLPLAAVIGKAEIMDAPEPGGLGGTFAGNPVACAAALAVLDAMDEAFLARARHIGERIGMALRALESEFSAVADVRGLGAMMAMELSSGAPDLVAAARERGLLLLLAGDGDVVRILVPLVVRDEELDEGFDILRSAMRAVYEVSKN